MIKFRDLPKTEHWQVVNVTAGVLNVRFKGMYYMKTISNKMWKELADFIEETNFVIYSTACMFESANIENFHIPSQYEYLFDNVIQCDRMFARSRIHNLNLNLKSKHLSSANEMCIECIYLRHINLTFESEILKTTICMLYRCDSLLSAKLKFNTSELSPSNIFSNCIDLTSLMITFMRPCSIRHDFNFDNLPRLRWFRIFGKCDYGGKVEALFGFKKCPLLLWCPLDWKLNFIESNGRIKVSTVKYCNDLFIDTSSFYAINSSLLGSEIKHLEM